MQPKALKSCPKSNKSPNLVLLVGTLIHFQHKSKFELWQIWIRSECWDRSGTQVWLKSLISSELSIWTFDEFRELDFATSFLIYLKVVSAHFGARLEEDWSVGGFQAPLIKLIFVSVLAKNEKIPETIDVQRQRERSNHFTLLLKNICHWTLGDQLCKTVVFLAVIDKAIPRVKSICCLLWGVWWVFTWANFRQMAYHFPLDTLVIYLLSAKFYL